MTDSPLLDSQVPVLIVEDNVQYAKVLRLMLQGIGYRDVTWVEAIGEAIELFKSDAAKRWRILFLDYHFPDGRNGGELLEYLKTSGKISAITAFLITAEPDLENFKQAVTAGVSGIVAKPFDAAEIRRQLEKAERARKLAESDSF